MCYNISSAVFVRLSAQYRAFLFLTITKGNDTMPCVDMPLERLKSYMGVSPCPADFSEKQVIIYPDYGHKSLKGSSDTIFEFMCNL